jgi:hypothetical protein
MKLLLSEMNAEIRINQTKEAASLKEIKGKVTGS